jgi:hypothetical protein
MTGETPLRQRRTSNAALKGEDRPQPGLPRLTNRGISRREARGEAEEQGGRHPARLDVGSPDRGQARGAQT